eukprot:m.267680 g.267680  ORF g.267680 m.267680 type:complete len:177 (+) comp40518_c0_seq34:2992-3522(+)
MLGRGFTSAFCFVFGADETNSTFRCVSGDVTNSSIWEEETRGGSESDDIYRYLDDSLSFPAGGNASGGVAPSLLQSTPIRKSASGVNAKFQQLLKTFPAVPGAESVASFASGVSGEDPDFENLDSRGEQLRNGFNYQNRDDSLRFSSGPESSPDFKKAKTRRTLFSESESDGFYSN